MDHSGNEGHSSVVWDAPNRAPFAIRGQLLTLAGAMLLLIGIGTALGANDSGSTWADPKIFIYAGLPCVVLGIVVLWNDRGRAIVEVRFESAAAPSEFTVRRLDGSSGTYSTADVDRVSVTCSAYGDGLWMDISIDGSKHHTGAGGVDEAEPMLAIFRQAGATVTVEHLDLPD